GETVMRRILLFLFLNLSLIVLPVAGQDQPVGDKSAPAPASEEPAGATEEKPLTVDDFGVDMDLEVRILLGAKTGLAGALPPDLNDMRDALRKRFDYTTYSLWNTIHVVAWPGESTTVQIVPEHFLTVEPLAADAERGLVKARVFLYRIPETAGGGREYIASPQGAMEMKRPRVHQREIPLLESPMTVTRDDWKAIGGVELWLSADSQHLRSTGTTTQQGLITPGGSSSTAGGVKRYLIVGIRIAED
ncbi:MAG: hypothetical protein ABIH23_33940, partial [bacterium]